jgi:hypothetical protein
MAPNGLSDGHIQRTRAVVIEFARSLSVPLWEATFADAMCDDSDSAAAATTGALPEGRSILRPAA